MVEMIEAQTANEFFLVDLEFAIRCFFENSFTERGADMDKEDVKRYIDGLVERATGVLVEEMNAFIVDVQEAEKEAFEKMQRYAGFAPEKWEAIDTGED